MSDATALHAEIAERVDPGIAPAVKALLDAGIETYESCQGGNGHCFAEPTVKFHGERSEGFKALAVVQELGFHVRALRRCWAVNDGEPTGPTWELVFFFGLYRDLELRDAVLRSARDAGTAEEWFRRRAS
jgi:hypothetical protein